MKKTKLVVGNWKMNGLLDDSKQRISQTLSFIKKHKKEMLDNVDVIICPPATLLSTVHEMTSKHLLFLGGQDCHTNMAGAFTGDISAEMLKEHGCSSVIVGHSERRFYHNESDELIAKKGEAVHKAGMTAIICVGETAKERAAGLAKKVVKAQIMNSMPNDTLYADNTVIAYEPIWAIGSGQTATQANIEEMHNFIREVLEKKYPALAETQILYGGSVQGTNAAQIFKYQNVGGVLVGGASLKPPEFCKIIEAALKA